MIHLNNKEKALVHSETGEIVRPRCYDDLSAYHSYLVGRKHYQAAQSMLQEVFKGEKVISKMIAASQKRGLTN